MSSSPRSSLIELENIVTTYFTAEQIINTREKIGYFPATRRALNHELVCHNIVEDKDGGIDSLSDPMGEIYNIIERESHRCVNELTSRGYSLAICAKAFVNRVVPETSVNGQQCITRTELATQEHQNLLESYGTAGVHFCR